MDEEIVNIISKALKNSEYHYFMLESETIINSNSEYFKKNYNWDGIVINKTDSLEKQFEYCNLPSTVTLLEVINNPEFLLNLEKPVMQTVSCYPINIVFIYSNILLDFYIKNILSSKFYKINTKTGDLYVNNNFKCFI